MQGKEFFEKEGKTCVQTTQQDTKYISNEVAESYNKCAAVQVHRLMEAGRGLRNSLVKPPLKAGTAVAQGLIGVVVQNL